ncbi:nonsense-mediated mRNA decay factor SMG9 [Hylaeus volcanicus]|uniref:nonsense-mediated mRNA decay factor SMG9 n=1 Tax=Hylaeus volcanicus TaxID=313075 RepID=UPI0023B7ECCA|nr:nonsense-mediated mRNA decay factor SMG9 [Hylaeus volcanicus]XP_053982443.1 nonsense-mediated mRNA decay factor SMG9 [Hylaeus volcanicus]
MNVQKMIPIAPKESETRDNDSRGTIKVIDRPTFILKTREGESRAVSPSQRNGGNKKEVDSSSNVPSKIPDSTRTILSTCLEMTNSVKFMDENMQLCENPLEFLYDQQDFLVVGCLGAQGVGKSTIMSLLTSNYVPNIFPTQDMSHHESGANSTSGIDFFVTKNRVIYLDTQPILSGSTIDYSASYDQKKPTTDFANMETNLELQSLQFAAFLFSVCHVIIFVQDWFVDLNLVRFLQTAEMLKPSSTSNMDQDYVEYYPHIVFLHNKAELQDFTPNTMEKIKEFYSKVFSSSRLQTHSGLDMSNHSMDAGLNLFFIPQIVNEEPTMRQNEKKLIEKLRTKIHGVNRNQMTPSTLTEKNWYHYVSRVMEAIKKSHLSSEYGRLMP